MDRREVSNCCSELQIENKQVDLLPQEDSVVKEDKIDEPINEAQELSNDAIVTPVEQLVNNEESQTEQPEEQTEEKEGNDEKEKNSRLSAILFIAFFAAFMIALIGGLILFFIIVL